MKKEDLQKLIYVPGDGLGLSPIMVIGEAPGAKEEELRKPFKGRSGKFLRNIVSESTTHQVYYTNVVKVRPLNNRKPTPEECNSWFPVLLNEIQMHQNLPTLQIVLLGKTASSIIEKYRHILPINVEIHEIDHPAYALRIGKQEEYTIRLKEIFAKVQTRLRETGF